MLPTLAASSCCLAEYRRKTSRQRFINSCCGRGGPSITLGAELFVSGNARSTDDELKVSIFVSMKDDSWFTLLATAPCSCWSVRSNRIVTGCPGNRPVTAEIAPSTVLTGHKVSPNDVSIATMRSPILTA